MAGWLAGLLACYFVGRLLAAAACWLLAARNGERRSEKRVCKLAHTHTHTRKLGQTGLRDESNKQQAESEKHTDRRTHSESRLHIHTHAQTDGQTHRLAERQARTHKRTHRRTQFSANSECAALQTQIEGNCVKKVSLALGWLAVAQKQLCAVRSAATACLCVCEMRMP